MRLATKASEAKLLGSSWCLYTTGEGERYGLGLELTFAQAEEALQAVEEWLVWDRLLDWDNTLWEQLSPHKLDSTQGMLDYVFKVVTANV